MQKLTMDQIHAIQLEMLAAFSDYCIKEGLCYRLCGGTLLGAVRHKGFIPWDDDVDVCMPRPDYALLEQKILDSGGVIDGFPKYCLFRTPKSGLDKLWIRLFDTRTSVKSISFSSDSGLWIDIFPVDGMSEDNRVNKQIMDDCHRVRSLLNARTGRWFKARKKILAIPKAVAKVATLLVPDDWYINKAEKIATRISYDSSRYVGMVVNGNYGIKERMNKDEFEVDYAVSFEGLELKTFSCWDTYLSNLYDNYWEYPPEEERVGHFSSVVIQELKG